MKEYSFVVFRAFLQYIYTDTVIVSPEDAIGELFVVIYGYVMDMDMFYIFIFILSVWKHFAGNIF